MNRQTVSKLVRDVVGSPLLAPLIAGINIPLILASKNAYMFTTDEIWTSIALLSGVLVCGSILLAVVLQIASGLARLEDKGKTVLFDMVFASAALLLFAYLSHHINKAIVPRVALLWVAYAVAGTAVLIHVRRQGTSVLNVILLILNLVAVGQLAWAKQTESKLCRKMDRTISATAAGFNHVRFTQTPNVYLIVMESYQDNQSLKSIYGMNNSYFTDSLASMGFTVYHDVFANYDHTLPSIVSLFLARHNYYALSMGNQDGPGMRHIIGGRLRNPTLETFRANGYLIQYLHGSSYCYFDSPMIDFSYVNRDPLRLLSLLEVEPIKSLVAKFNRRRLAGFPSMLEERISQAAISRQPYFSFIKIDWPGHTPARFESLPARLRDDATSREVYEKTPWKLFDYWPKAYVTYVRNANRILRSVLEQILLQDPNAAVIVMGDHGARRYRGLTESQADPNVTAIANDISTDILARDTFGILCAIKWPSGQTNSPLLLSPITIFPRIFESLGTNRLVSSQMAENLSIARTDKLYMAARDGKILSPWVPTSPPDPALSNAEQDPKAP